MFRIVNEDKVIPEAKLFIENLKQHEFFQFIDIEFLEVNTERAVGRMKFDSKFLNHYGTVHGGMLYALADTVAGIMVCMCGRICTTVDGHLNYFEPAINTEYVYCEATLIRSGNHLANAYVRITGDDGQLFDDGTINYFKLKNDPYHK